MQRDAPPTFGQLNLVVTDMDATLAFYRLLGLEIEADSGVPHAAVTLPSGMLVEFDTADFVTKWDSGWAGTTGGSTVLGFWVRSREAVDETHARLVGAGYVDHQPPYDAFWGGRFAIVDDPDGNGIGLMSPQDSTRRFWPPSQPPSSA